MNFGEHSVIQRMTPNFRKKPRRSIMFYDKKINNEKRRIWLPENFS